MGRPRKITPADAQEEGTVRCVVIRDYWPTEDESERVRAGTLVDLTPMDALAGIESGTVKRYIPDANS